MAPDKESANTEERKPSPRRRSKPSFEVPEEVAAAPLAAWIERAAVPAPPPVLVPEVTLPQPAASATRANGAPQVRPRGGGLPDPETLMLASIEAMAYTVAASTRLMLAAASLMGAPIEVTRRILGLKD